MVLVGFVGCETTQKTNFDDKEEASGLKYEDVDYDFKKETVIEVDYNE